MAALRTTLQRLRPGSAPLSQSFTNRAYQPALRAFTTTPQTLNNNTENDIPNINITNYYTLFPSTLPSGPPPNPETKFDIPLRTLRTEFLSLQNRTHPDKYPPGAPKQKAEALSALLNEAYRTLSDPLARAQYLLKIQHNIDVTAEESAATDKQALDPETLMAVMEVQEKIEELAEEEGSGEEAEKVIEEMKGENRERVEEGVKVLGEMVERGDVEGMRRECVRLRFWYSVGEGLKEWTPGVREIRLVH